MAVIKIVPMPGAVGDKGDEGAPGPQGQQGPAGQNGLPGTPALWSYQGAYNPAAAYAVGDIVTYQGQLYYTKSVTTAGTLPTDTSKFDLIAAKGADGTNGTNGTNGADGADGADGSGNADIADFVFTDDYNETGRSGISLPGDKGMIIAAGEESDLYLTAGDDLYIQTLGEGDDIHLNAADDIRFTTGNQNIDFATPPYWSMNSEGELHLPGAGYISNPENSSGDGYGNDTLVLVPDGDIIQQQYHQDQYLIIDPTAPNHIHIRAGGVQDASTADLFLGAERNNVKVSDPSNNVTINTRPYGTENTYGNSNESSNTQFIHASTADIIVGDTVRLYTGGATYVVTTVTQDSPSAGFITVVADGLSFITGESYVFTRDQGYSNQWTFGNDGVLYGPAMGGIWVESIQKKSEQYGLGIYSPVDIVLEASNGEFLNDSSNPDNQIATIGDLPTGATGTFETSDSKLITVTNGIITSIESLT
jgi:hypothetical protein